MTGPEARQAAESAVEVSAHPRGQETGVAGLPAQSIFDGIPDAISMLDREWRYVYVNAPAEALAGMDRKQLLGRVIWQVFPGLLGTRFESSARSAIAAQRPATLEQFLPTLHRWYEHRFYPTPQGLLFFTTDIDDRKWLDEWVRESERVYKQLFDATSEGILVVDDEGRYVDVNDSYCRMLKASRERLIGAHFSVFIPPERLQDAVAAFSALKTGKPTPVEFPLRAADGSIVELEWSSASHFLPNLSFCICRDLTQQRRAQMALQTSEERQRRAVEAGKVGLWEWDIQKNRVTWSDYINELYGLKPGTFGGTVEAFAKLIDPRDRERVTEALDQALAGGAEYHIEFRPVRPDGKPTWLETSGRVTFDSQGMPAMMHGAVIDTTARRVAEEAQNEIERQLVLLVEASGALLASPRSSDVLNTILDLARRFVSADGHAVWRKDHESVWRIGLSTGLSPKYLSSALPHQGSTVPDGPMLFKDVETNPILERRRPALREEGIRSMLAIPLRIQSEPSGMVVFYWRSPHRFSESEVRIAAALGNLAAAALGTAEVYDKQLELRAEAEAAHRRARFLAEAGAVLSSSLDFDATLTSMANLAVPVFADWASVEVLDQHKSLRRVAVAHSDPEKIRFAQEFAQKYPPRDGDASMVALRTGRSIVVDEVTDEMIVRRAYDAEHLRLLRELGLKSVIIAPMLIKGESVGVISFVTAESGRRYNEGDLQTAEELARRAASALENARLYEESQRIRAELERRNRELHRANEDLNQFAYSVSHDLQEPLRMVAIYSQLLQRNGTIGPDSQADQYLNYVLEGSRRLEALLRDILEYSYAANPDEAQTETVEADRVLSSALVNLEGAIAKTGACITQGAMPRVRMREVHLIQLFQNVIGNAIKYRSKEPPRIEVTARKEGGMWLFAVRDNGIGIDPAYQKQIFGLFKRLHSREAYPGTGVGLAICQKIVERYGGSIWVESQEGKGSTFFFTLPEAE